MQREPYWDYMRRRLSEEDMRESYFDANDIKILKSQTEELQGQLQEAYKKIKLLNSCISLSELTGFLTRRNVLL